MNPTEALRQAVTSAAQSLVDEEGHGSGALSTAPTLERPKKADFGDFSSNVAMLLAPTLGSPPRDVAGRVGDKLAQQLGGHLARFEVAGPGFLNLFLSDDWHVDALGYVLDAADAFGAGGAPHPERVNIEFVSANPTGPLHVGHARNAAYGDALARLLMFAGHDVAREFYVNDYGSQIVRLAESLRARARGEDVPEGGYVGDYVIALAAEIDGAADMDLDELGRLGVARNLEHIRESLERFRVSFEIWFSERSLHERARGRRLRRGRPRVRGARRARPDVHERGRAVAAHVGPRRGPRQRARALDRRPHVLRLRHRLPPEQARAWLPAADRRVGRRPPRPRAADEGGLRGAGRRPRRARADHHAVRPPGRPRRRAGVDVQAGRGVRDARRAGRRDRRRRGALVPAVALARHDDRSRSRSRGQRELREPRVLRAVRARADRVGPAQGRRGCGARRVSRPASTCIRPSVS